MTRCFHSYLRCAGWLLTALSLPLTATALWASPALSQAKPAPIASVSQGGTIAQAMQNLRKSNKIWIEVNTTTQRLIVWDGKIPLHAVVVSTGKSSSPTPTGVFAVESKLTTTRMQGDDYDVPDVPFTMFYSGNYAIHGAYWHRNFGTPVSHGCVNVAVDHAERIFNWAKVGTPVVVHK